MTRSSFLTRLAAILATAAAFATTPQAIASGPAGAPPCVDARALHEQYARDGKGIETAAAAPGRLTVYVAFDPQCPDCIAFWKEARPLADQVRFVWLPIAVLNPFSEPQGAAMLSAANPLAAMDRHAELFGNTPRAANHSGLVRDSALLPAGELTALPMAARESVWTNSRIFRRTGGRSVPLGVFVDSKGEVQVIPDTVSTAELRKRLGLP
jgi:thiol:disulfide interchange protein DsbG